MPELNSIIAPLIAWVANNIHWILIALFVFAISMGTVAYLILLERKIAAWTQDRIGPNRTGLGFGIIPILKDMKMFGLGQSFADGLKMFTKEDYRPKNTDRALFTLAPMLMMGVVLVSIAVIPWGGVVGNRQTKDITAHVQAGKTATQAVVDQVPGSRRVEGAIDVYVAPAMPEGKTQPTAIYEADGTLVAGSAVAPAAGDHVFASYVEGWRFQVAPLNIGVLFVVATLSLAVYGVVVGGYASNNKYSFLGGLRATANMISYEIPLGLSILCIVVMFGTLDLGEIVSQQTKTLIGVNGIGLPAWNVFTQPLAFVLFLICIHAEANRAPFDTAEAEQELVGGYHTEYSSMRFGMFYLAEYAGMITTSAVCVALFFGGWHLPGIATLSEKLFGAVHDANNPWLTSSVIEGILRAAIFFTKTIAIVAIFMWTRWSLPRFRFDQIMNLAWKMLIPVSLGLLVSTAAGVFVIYRMGGRTTNGISLREGLLFLAINVAVVAVTLVVGKLLPTGMEGVNRKIAVPNSRYAPRATA
ncbi:MAG: NADH-quinone oxidoreductase subunit H [Tepidisphaeraceae bacterium]